MPKRGKKGKATPRGEAVKKRATEVVDQRLMKALSHETRVQILSLLVDGEWSPNMLSKELDTHLSKISYHIKQLLDFELIELTKEEPRRGAVEHFYKAVERIIIPEGMSEALPKGAKLETLKRILMLADSDMKRSLKSKKFYNRSDFHASWSPCDMDEKGRIKIHSLLDKAIEEVIETEGESANRIAKGESEAIPTSIAIFAFSSDRKAGEQTSAFRQRV